MAAFTSPTCSTRMRHLSLDLFWLLLVPRIFKTPFASEMFEFV